MESPGDTNGGQIGLHGIESFLFLRSLLLFAQPPLFFSPWSPCTPSSSWSCCSAGSSTAFFLFFCFGVSNADFSKLLFNDLRDVRASSSPDWALDCLIGQAVRWAPTTWTIASFFCVSAAAALSLCSACSLISFFGGVLKSTKPGRLGLFFFGVWCSAFISAFTSAFTSL